jgi:hypothetical protein
LTDLLVGCLHGGQLLNFIDVRLSVQRSDPFTLSFFDDASLLPLVYTQFKAIPRVI